MISYSNIKKNFYIRDLWSRSWSSLYKSLNKILNENIKSFLYLKSNSKFYNFKFHENINILLKYNQPIKSTPKIHYVDFKKLEKYKKSNQNHHKI